MTEFFVLANVDEYRTLASSEQAAAVRGRGFTRLEFSIDAPTRGFAQRAWEAHRSQRTIDYDGGETDDDWGLERLTGREITSVVALVVALVDQDRPVLERAGAYESPASDPYLWTRDYGRWGRVDLALPPGDPRHWAGGVIRNADNPASMEVIVDMWTEQEGPSDLSLQVDLDTGPDGAVIVRFGDLHVM